MLGGVVSTTRTLKLQRFVIPASSTASQFTLVTPCGNTVPDGGIHLTVTLLPQLSTATAAKITGTPLGPAHSASWSIGHCKPPGARLHGRVSKVLSSPWIAFPSQSATAR